MLNYYFNFSDFLNIKLMKTKENAGYMHEVVLQGCTTVVRKPVLQNERVASSDDDIEANILLILFHQF
jgi:hypothetical protein